MNESRQDKPSLLSPRLDSLIAQRSLAGTHKVRSHLKGALD